MLSKISGPEDLKKLDRVERLELVDAIRKRLIDVISKQGGHLGASLGAVEIAVAVHYVFNSPHDRIIWDVGHQAYAHKILTGRNDLLESIRHNPQGHFHGKPFSPASSKNVQTDLINSF